MLIALAPAPLPTPQKYPVESSKVSFPNAKTCRELERLKKEVEALQEKCKECHSKNPGGDQSKIPVLERGVDSLKRGLKTIVEQLDHFLSHQKRDAKIQKMQQAWIHKSWHGPCICNNTRRFTAKLVKSRGQERRHPRLAEV